MTMTDQRVYDHDARPSLEVSPTVTVNGQNVPTVREDRVQRAQMFIELGKMDTELRVERAMDRILEEFEAKLLQGICD